MKNDRRAINFEIFVLDILSCKGAITKLDLFWQNAFSSYLNPTSCFKFGMPVLRFVHIQSKGHKGSGK